MNDLLIQLVMASQRLSPKTKRTYLGRVREFTEFAGNPSRWTVVVVEAWRDSLVENGLTPDSVNGYIAAVRFAAKRFNERGHGPNFAIAAERLRTPMREPEARALSVNECKRLLATCQGNYPPNIRDRAMILVGIHAAFRREEIVSITFNRLRDHRITVIAKGERLHTVQVNNNTWQAIHRWTAWLASRGITEDRVFRNLRPSIEEDGWAVADKLTADGFAKILKLRGVDANIENLHPHILRHTYTSLALQAGVPAWRIKKVLGHRSDLMMERYAHDLNTTATGASFPEIE